MTPKPAARMYRRPKRKARFFEDVKQHRTWRDESAEKVEKYEKELSDINRFEREEDLFNIHTRWNQSIKPDELRQFVKRQAGAGRKKKIEEMNNSGREMKWAMRARARFPIGTMRWLLAGKEARTRLASFKKIRKKNEKK